MNLSRSIERGLHYLRSNQAGDGFWSDWQLPPGESRIWTTAYVGYRLSAFPPEHRALVDQPLARAAAWLRASEFSDGGWGYAEQTGPDADSTSLAMLFLRTCGDSISDRRLPAYQQTDGGFSTFTRNQSYGSWVQSHPDVTATALLALLPTPFSLTDRLGAGIDYVRSRQRDDGLWNSFWWTSCLYATEATLAFLQEAGESFDRTRVTASLFHVPTTASFESALLLMCLMRAGAGHAPLAAEHAEALQAAQLPDGSWPSRPILRLTSREICEPWLVQDAGPVFQDDRRVFTTATVLAALAAFKVNRRIWRVQGPTLR